METYIANLLKELGEDITREGLIDTPKRAVKALQFLTEGYRQNIDEIVNNALFGSASCGAVMVKDIELYSLCEHHILPFVGKCHVSYLPNGKVIGLSKIARIVNLFAHHLQIQERLTQQIAECIMTVTNASGAAVVIEAKHMCMMMRGVQKQNSVMETSTMLGAYAKDATLRAEMLNQIHQSKI